LPAGVTITRSPLVRFFARGFAISRVPLSLRLGM
jgi:hypothetical protein